MLTLEKPVSTQAMLVTHPATVAIPPTVTDTAHGHSANPVAFTGDWLADGCHCHTYREGYAGILTRRWNGWAVFTVTRPVAEAVVARHQTDFTAQMRQQITNNADPAHAWLRTLRGTASITWLTDMIVVDSRAMHDDDTMVEICAPSADGRYTIGWGWTWDDVDIADIHTVHTGQSR